MVVDGNSRTRTPVRTGLVSGGQTQILQGLTAGQQVVVATTVPAGTTGTTNRNGNGGFFGGGLRSWKYRLP